jgi:uncharacterized protein
MKRKAEEFIEEWIHSYHRKPLIIRGARQVGKSTLVRNFAAQNDFDLVEINLEKTKGDYWESNNITLIIREIEVITGRNISKKSLLFIDEIQAIPAAISALRYFYEEKPDLPVIAAGSLLEFTLGSTEYSMPVGRVQYYHLGPMTFMEVLEARNKPVLQQWLVKMQEKEAEEEIPESAFNTLWSYYKEFLFVGGMPEAAAAFLETNSFNTVSQIHRSILQTYRDDFGKYGKLNTSRIERIFDFIPLHVGEKVIYSNISNTDQARDIREALDCLIKARIVLPVYHSNCSGIPLKAGKNSRVYKCFFLDVGLTGHCAGITWNDLNSKESDILIKGSLGEQFVAQHLQFYQGSNDPPELYYWLREGKSRNAEVDFVIVKDSKIIPIEVKSGKTGTMRALHQFMARQSCSKGVRLDSNHPSVQYITTEIPYEKKRKTVSYRLESYPVYLIEMFQR